MSTSKTCYLPNEVLEHIMGYLGVPALHALVEADSQAKVIFYSRPRLMLLSALRNCSMALQIEQLALAVTYVRSRPGKNWALECLRQLVHSKMNDDSVRLSLEASISSEKSDPRALFEDSANVHRQVAQAEVSLVKVQLPKTADRIRRAVDREDLGWPIHCPREGKLEKPPSPTELHRIRRALWRLWLYFDIFHDPRRNKVYLSHHQNLVAQYSFFSQLTIWELEEIDCVYYHLQHQNQCLWRRQCTICSQQVLPDVIFNGICKECRRDKETNVRMTEKEREDDPDTASFSYARSWSREHMYRREPVVEWTDSATANRPNAGFQHLAKSSDREHVTNTYRHDASLGCFLDWGYCMWDESRFRAWHLVDNADTKPQKDEADIEKLDKSPSEPKLPIDRNKRAVKGWWTDKSPSESEIRHPSPREKANLSPIKLRKAHLQNTLPPPTSPPTAMVLKIRLARFGKRNAPFYNIVVAQARTARNSKPVEVLGTYDPIPKPAPLGEGKPFKDVKLDTARAKYWLGVGAQPSEPAWRLLSMIGLMEPKYSIQRIQQMGAERMAAHSGEAADAPGAR